MNIQALDVDIRCRNSNSKKECRAWFLEKWQALGGIEWGGLWAEGEWTEYWLHIDLLQMRMRRR